MRRTLQLPAVIAMFAVFALGACDESIGPAEEGSLDQEASIEVFNKLASQVVLIGLGALGEVTGAGNAAGGGSISLALEPISMSVPCDDGGTIRVTGDITDDIDGQGTGSIGIDIRQEPNSCAIETSKGVVTVDGDPDLRVTVSMSVADGEPVGVHTFAYEGGFTWSGPDGSGGCKVNVSYSLDWDKGGGAWSGTMCGNSL